MSFTAARAAVSRKPRGAVAVPARAAVPGDFATVFIRRALRARLRGSSEVVVRCSRGSWLTIVHRYLSAWDGRTVELPVAQLRARQGQLQLYWRHTTGRWVAYQGDGRPAFVGGLHACLVEISHDRWGCFWG